MKSSGRSIDIPWPITGDKKFSIEEQKTLDKILKKINSKSSCENHK